MFEFNANESFQILAEISSVLTAAKSPKTAFSAVLEILREKCDFRRGFVFFYSPANERLQLFAANNLSANEFRKLENRVEKTFVAQVYESGKTVVAPRVELETVYAAAFDDSPDLTACVCVPILFQQKSLGAFGVEFDAGGAVDYEKISEFLKVAAALFAQTVKVERAIAVEREKMMLESSNLQRELREKYDFETLVGNSGEMRRVVNQIAQVARSNTPVLLRGESGTGKELIANSIHYNSLRSKKNLVKIHCQSLPPDLLDAELFGKKSRLEQAANGTLLIDEIADLPAPAQLKLLRAIESKEFEKSDGETVKTNFRLIAATTKNLEKLIEIGEFREDLFYRLNVFTIFLPPLRQRTADILLLAEHFVEKYERAHGKHIKRISTPAIDMLTSYHYPGNVRELENAVERAVLLCDGNVIHGHHLPPTLQTADVTGTVVRVSLENAVESFERDLIADALKTTGGNCVKAAKLLDTTERILNYKIKKYSLEPRRYKK